MIGRLRSNDLVRHGAIVFGGIVVASLFNYLFYMLMGRRLDVEAYGVVTSLASAMLVVGAPANVGQLIVARLAADLEARGDVPAIRRLADLATAWSMRAAAIVVVLGLLAREPLAAYFNLTDSRPIVVTTFALGGYAIVMIQRGVFQGAHRFEDLASSLSLDAVAKVVAGVALAGILGATGGLLGLAVGVSLAFAYNLYAFRARFGTQRAPVALDRSLIVRVVSHVGIGQLTLTLLSFYDVPLVKHIFDARSAGLYAAVALVGRAVLSAVSFVPILVLPKAASRVAAGRSPLPLLAAALGIAGGIVLVAVVFGAVAPRSVVTLIAGPAFGEAAPLVFLYVLASGALSLASVVAAYRMGLHRYDFVWPALGVAALEMGVLSVWHPSLVAVVGLLAVGHSLVLAVTVVGVTTPTPIPASAPAIPEVA